LILAALQFPVEHAAYLRVSEWDEPCSSRITHRSSLS